MLKKYISYTVIILIFLFGIRLNCRAEEPTVSASGCVLMDAATGDVLYSKNPDKSLSMASTTKIMTALLLIEAGNPDTTVDITDEMVRVEGTSMGLSPGMKVKRSDLYYGMLLSSGNDAANAAALHLGGSFEQFAVYMNQKAEEIGMENTHFVTPSGLDADDHFTTAYDMALLTKYALSNDTFAKVCSTRSITLFYGDTYHTLTNHNKLLNMYDGCIGVKTGFTSKSGRCLVSAAERNGQTLICVTLKDGNDWNDHISLFDYGFSLSERIDITPDIGNKIEVVGGINDHCEIRAEECSLNIFSGQKQRIRYETDLSAFLYAPVEIGQKVGSVIVYIDDVKITELNIVAVTSSDYAVPAPKKPKTFWQCLIEILGA